MVERVRLGLDGLQGCKTYPAPLARLQAAKLRPPPLQSDPRVESWTAGRRPCCPRALDSIRPYSWEGALALRGCGPAGDSLLCRPIVRSGVAGAPSPPCERSISSQEL